MTRFSAKPQKGISYKFILRPEQVTYFFYLANAFRPFQINCMFLKRSNSLFLTTKDILVVLSCLRQFSTNLKSCLFSLYLASNYELQGLQFFVNSFNVEVQLILRI